MPDDWEVAPNGLLRLDHVGHAASDQRNHDHERPEDGWPEVPDGQYRPDHGSGNDHEVLSHVPDIGRSWQDLRVGSGFGPVGPRYQLISPITPAAFACIANGARLAAELRQGRDAPASEAAARELLEPSGAGNNSTSQAPPRTIARRSHLPPEQI